MDIGEQMLVCGAEIHRVEDSMTKMYLLRSNRGSVHPLFSAAIKSFFRLLSSKSSNQPRKVKKTENEPVKRMRFTGSFAGLFRRHIEQRDTEVGKLLFVDRRRTVSH